ncbi:MULTISPECIES: cytochrome c [Pseudophaeobacter]|jgi:mono/diheme cytochrome c family protein|uniref:Cytochrome c n=1 Tax=Pseudophaeobacter arcticus TaxID=385492 RepID=A0ABQ0AS07_9RHOB|nr:cytochrome c [Pseudophaeobacter sp. EL27]
MRSGWRKGIHFWFILPGVGIASFAISYFSHSGGSVTFEEPVGTDVAKGAALYLEYCASCHGEELEGEVNWHTPKEDGTLPAPPHDENGHTWHHGDDLLFNYTKLGGQVALEAAGVSGFQSGMPGFADQLSDREIRDILSFIKSSWPEKIREIQRQRTEGATTTERAGN